jgi:glycosyltransferase involved in cell wall biosynthesis
VTATGDIPDYLTDRHSAYLVYSDKVEAFTQTLRHVMKNMTAAWDVGQRGRKVAEENFDVNLHCRRLLGWFEQIGAAQD